MYKIRAKNGTEIHTVYSETQDNEGRIMFLIYDAEQIWRWVLANNYVPVVK